MKGWSQFNASAIDALIDSVTARMEALLSRYNPHHNVTALQAAANDWVATCLLGDGSVFLPGARLWTLPFLDELDIHFVQNLDKGKGSFIDKLKQQLSTSSPSARKLMAELMWVLNLFPSKTGSDSKRQTVREIWSWSGDELASNHPNLADEVLSGVGSTGTAYNTQRWRELSFFIEVLRDLKAKTANEREHTLSDPWQFLEWLQAQPGAQKRQLLHILPHLVFPDTFERISTGGDKVAILSAFGSEPKKVWKKRQAAELDHALLDLRQKLEEEYGGPIDFYFTHSSRWRSALSEAAEPSVDPKISFASALEDFLGAYANARDAQFTTAGVMGQSMEQLRRWLQTCPPVASEPFFTIASLSATATFFKVPCVKPDNCKLIGLVPP